MRKFQIFMALLLTVVLLAACSRSSAPSNQADGGTQETQGAVEDTMEKNSTENASIEGTSSQEPEGSTEEGSTQEIGTEETGTGEKDEVPSISEFLSAIADEVILDEAEFTVWADYIGAVRVYTSEGFIPCELVMDGEHFRSLYTEDGLVAVEIAKNRTWEHDYYDYIFLKDGNELHMKLGLPLCEKMGFHFYDMDGDGSDELVIGGWAGEGEPSFCYVIRPETMTEIPIAIDKDEDYFTYYVPEIVLTEVEIISDTDVRLSYAATDKNGNMYEGCKYVYEAGYTIKLPLTENEEYEIYAADGIASLSGAYGTETGGRVRPNGTITCTALKYCRNTRSYGFGKSLSTIKIYCEYDAASDSFQPVKVILSLGSEEKGGEEQWVEIDIK